MVAFTLEDFVEGIQARKLQWWEREMLQKINLIVEPKPRGGKSLRLAQHLTMTITEALLKTNSDYTWSPKGMNVFVPQHPAQRAILLKAIFAAFIEAGKFDKKTSYEDWERGFQKDGFWMIIDLQ